MTTLLDITDDLRALDDLIESVGGDITDPSVDTAINNWLDELNTNLSEKVDNLSLIHISEPTRLRRSRMPSSA